MQKKTPAPKVKELSEVRRFGSVWMIRFASPVNNLKGQGLIYPKIGYMIYIYIKEFFVSVVLGLTNLNYVAKGSLTDDRILELRMCQVELTKLSSGSKEAAQAAQQAQFCDLLVVILWSLSENTET